jgi:hypothetical protein
LKIIVGNIETRREVGITMNNMTAKLSRAQRGVMDSLHRCSQTPYEQRNASHNRLGGRGMARTLAALTRMGLVTFTEHFNRFAYSTTFYGYLTEAGRPVAAECAAIEAERLAARMAKRDAQRAEVAAWKAAGGKVC